MITKMVIVLIFLLSSTQCFAERKSENKPDCEDMRIEYTVRPVNFDVAPLGLKIDGERGEIKAYKSFEYDIDEESNDSSKDSVMSILDRVTLDSLAVLFTNFSRYKKLYDKDYSDDDLEYDIPDIHTIIYCCGSDCYTVEVKCMPDEEFAVPSELDETLWFLIEIWSNLTDD